MGIPPSFNLSISFNHVQSKDKLEMPNLVVVSFFLLFHVRSQLAFISAMGPPRVVMACTKAKVRRSDESLKSPKIGRNHPQPFVLQAEKPLEKIGKGGRPGLLEDFKPEKRLASASLSGLVLGHPQSKCSQERESKRMRK